MGASTWDDTPAPAADNSWKTGGDDAGTGGGWAPDSAADTNGFTGDFSAANVSKHADGEFDGDRAADGGCRICGQDGHFARDCPDKPPNSGGCFNCGEEGHNKSECPNPRVEREFTGECHYCGQVGHRGADCPDKPAAVCKLCKAEGHIATECSVNRIHSMIASMGIEDVGLDQSWANVMDADKEKDVEDIKKAIFSYAKSYPALTLEELEQTFRDSNMNTYLIAKEQAVSDTHTIVNFQGEAGKKFVVSFQFSAKPRRAKFAEGWPSSPEENLERLADAGFVMDALVQKCTNCHEIGHIAKNCEAEKNEAAKIVIICAVCNEEGHRARDCTQERKKPGKKGCRNCGSEEHIAKECTEPPNMDNVECKNCQEMGHFSRDCPQREPEICRNCYQEGHRAKDCENERVMKCRNCDELGHMSRECSKPTDWSRVKCSNCEEFGHSYKRCTKPAKEKEPEEDGGDAGGGDGGWGSGGGAASSGGGGGGGGWENSAAPAEETSGGW